jgi:hypothetical protein
MAASNVTAAQKARILAEALPFIRGYHAKTLVVRFGGRAMVEPLLKEQFALRPDVTEHRDGLLTETVRERLGRDTRDAAGWAGSVTPHP